MDSLFELPTPGDGTTSSQRQGRGRSPRRPNSTGAARPALVTQPALDSFGDAEPHSGPDSIYDPLRRENLGRSVLWALTSREAVRLDRIPRFNGCGIYAIYYAGDHELYAPIASDRCEVPIYVGKADPSGGAKV